MQLIYETDRLLLKILDATSAPQVLEYVSRNRDFLKEWEPEKTEEYFTMDFQARQLETDMDLMLYGHLLKLWVYKKEDYPYERIIGMIAFNNIVWGAFRSCHLGYKIDKDELNKGYVTEAVGKGIDIIFNEYQLHRIEANIMPHNARSMRVAEKLGFYDEGLALKYLNINGKWEDHIHMVLRNKKLE